MADHTLLHVDDRAARIVAAVAQGRGGGVGLGRERRKLARDRRQLLQIGRDAGQVAVREVARAVLDHIGHRTKRGDLVGAPRLQEHHDFFRAP
ncbi:hypothetical protein G6F22_019897 [Rhizopus arrhizus]|nr:hypothetical protein G6F22_019897 [Rhizopus arrhizus]KAG1166143.1 hypothetical protein G6F35_018367 [Rhizopus arrhizus]